MKRKKILIIYTGGTIGMSKTKKGYAPSMKSFLNNLDKIDELHNPLMPKWDIVAINPILDSSNISVNEWNKMAKVIADNYSKYDGFVMLHGTDTMAYSASALSFMLEGLSKPVIFTGSQIPLCEIRNDAKDNLITSLMIATNDKINEVCLYFGGKLLRGNRSIKYSSEGLIAFSSPNYPSLAEAGIEIKYRDDLLLKKTNKKFHLITLKQIPIGVIKIFPGIQFDLFESILTEKMKGIVIETFGSGNIPNLDGEILPMINRAFKSGTLVTVCSQCPHGKVSLGTYETSNSLKQAGAISGYDMTSEAAVAKLYYLFSQDLSLSQIKKQMETNLRGELDKM